MLNSNTLKSWHFTVIALILTVCGNLLAQDNPPPGPNESNRPPAPTIEYTIASPRACIIDITRPNSNRHWQRAAAENFPREDGEIKISAGTRVVFCLSRNLEAIWYEHTFGQIRSSIILQEHKPLPPLESRIAPNDVNDPNQKSWDTIGTDAANDIRRGPSIGRAKIGVPVLFRRPGVYSLRAIIKTSAKPIMPGANENKAKRPLARGILAEDIVHVIVKVVELPPSEIVPDEEPLLDPDVEFIIPMPKQIDPNNPNTPNNNLADFAILSQSYGRQLKIN
jgi:hypothetical protein